MARRLNTYIHVHVDGVSTAYGPGDKIPEAVAKLITAPGVWEGDEVEETPAPTPAPVPVEETSDIPKKNGSRDAWAAYADANGFEVDEDMKRDDIIAALKSNDIPVE